jgi:ABC-type multidrug transport system fused ATPase/permease subunit
MSSKKISIPLFKKLLSIASGQGRAFVLAMISLGAASALNLAFPAVIRNILNNDPKWQLENNVLWIGALLIGLFALQGIFFYVRILLFSKIGLSVVHDTRNKLFNKIINSPIQFFDNNGSGNLVSKLINDTSLLQDAVSIKLSVLVRYLVQIIFGLIAMMWLSPSLSLSVLAGLILLSGLSVILAKKLKNLSRSLQNAVANVSEKSSEFFTSIRAIKAFKVENFATKIFEPINFLSLTIGVERSKISAFFQSFVNFLMNSVLVIVMLYGLHMTVSSGISVGDLTSFLMYGVIVAVSFTFVISSYAELASNLGGLSEVFELLESNEISNTTPNITYKPLEKIIFNSVNFSYPSRPDNLVLKNCSFTIPGGKSTALVGVSGSGKTSILNLILDFYKISSGEISFHYKDFEPRNLSSTIGFVPQESLIFDLNIRDTITFGDLSISDTEINKILKELNLFDFVHSLDSGLNTHLGASGLKISGGQRQRLALARALIRKPSILLLDEVTASLDFESEQKVIELLNSDSCKNTTQVWVSHKLSTIKHVDHIIVFSEGQVAQEGSYLELANKPGLFSEFVRLQSNTEGA